MTFGEAKGVWKHTEGELLRIKNSKEPILDLLRLSITADKLSVETTAVIPIIEGIWSSSDIKMKTKITTLCKEGIIAVLVKFQKDKGIVERVDHDDSEFLPTDNRRCESLFAHFKYHEKAFIAMSQSTLEWVSKAKVNKLADWLKDMNEENRKVAIKDAKKGRYAIRILKKKEETMNRNFRLRSYSI
jgi:hypothetical protein